MLPGTLVSGGLFGLLAIPNPAAAEVATRPVLTFAAAFKAAEVAVATCQRQGQSVTVTVVNSEGALSWTRQLAVAARSAPWLHIQPRRPSAVLRWISGGWYWCLRSTSRRD